MPNCFQLIPKGQTEPEKLVVIDQKICEALEVECHPKYWCRGWYDLIGFGVACGKTFEQLRTIYPDMIDIIDFLDANYTTDAWAEVGGRR